MHLDCLLEIVNRQLIENQKRFLSATEILILHGIWEYKTYNEIAIKAGYSPGYFSNVVAPELYQRLSQVIGERVTKKNCRMILESYGTSQATLEIRNLQYLAENLVNCDRVATLPEYRQHKSPCYPSGSVPLDSPFYIKRSPIEDRVYQEIEKPGALIRIKAPREMGKTSMLLRIIDYGNRLGYNTVSLNLEQVEQTTLSDFNQFLRWFCANIAYQLQLKPMLEEYWDEDLGSKISCTLYLQKYILKSINNPLVLALDEVNQIFEHPQVAKDFLSLLRSWYEEAKREPRWQNLRWLVIHSTEIYVPLELNQSPFNVGLPIHLGSFSPVEVQKLAQRYGLDWEDGKETKQLMAMVGGHPALVHLAIYHLSGDEITMKQLIETAPTATGIYSHHLQRHWAALETQSELAQAFRRVLNATEPLGLDPIVAHKLSSMGLIKLSGFKAIPSCELYRSYFMKKGEQHLYSIFEPLAALK
ncbi:MAG: AAA-like domain-containing protein [Rivularia sp. (in: Bacteria)]|nr:AAA-like domain-containing protein [Rivularia sp. MS3]